MFLYLVNRQEKKGFQLERDPLEDNIELFDGSNGKLIFKQIPTYRTYNNFAH